MTEPRDKAASAEPASECIGSVRALESSRIDAVWTCDCGEANEWRVSPGTFMRCGKCDARVAMRVMVTPERQP